MQGYVVLLAVNTGRIVGGVMAGILVLIIMGAFMLMYRPHQKTEDEGAENAQ